MPHTNKSYRKAAKVLAHCLEKQIGLALPEEEINLIAHFFAGEKSSYISPKYAIFLVNHGNSTATSMAEVTNSLLGKEVIQPVDMPLDASFDETYNLVLKKIKGMPKIEGVLLLVDLGSLITLGNTIQHEVDFDVKTLSSVNLPMVLEAGRKSLDTNKSLDDIMMQKMPCYLL